MYQWNTRVRYSEVDENACLTVGGLINYLQDACIFQSEERKIGLDFLARRNSAWVISGWHIEIVRMPKLMEEIQVQTWPYRFIGFYGYRNFRICDREGNCLARANSLWVLVDTGTGRPVRIFEELAAGYELGEPLPMEEPPRKMKIPEGVHAEEEAPIVVQTSHLDTNHHVNNGQYVQMAMEYVKETGAFSKIRVEYKKPAVLGDVIYPRVAYEGGCLQVELCSEEKIPYAVVELTPENRGRKKAKGDNP